MHTSTSTNNNSSTTNNITDISPQTTTDERRPHPSPQPPAPAPLPGNLIPPPPPDILRIDGGGGSSNFCYTIPGRAQYQLADLADLNYMINQSRAFGGHPDPAAALVYGASSAAGGGVPLWPPRSYTCTFCRRDFASAQALGGHMNVHRRDRARLRRSSPPGSPTTSAESAGGAASYNVIPGSADFADSVVSAGTCAIHVSPQFRSSASRPAEMRFSAPSSSSFRQPELLHLYPNNEDPHFSRQPSDIHTLPDGAVPSHNFSARYDINTAAVEPETLTPAIPSGLSRPANVDVQPEIELELQHVQYYNRPAAALLLNAPAAIDNLDLELRLGRSLAAARNNNNDNDNDDDNDSNNDNNFNNENNINNRIRSPARHGRQE